MIFFALIQYNSSKSYPTSGEHEKRTVVVAHSVAAERKSKERFRCSETGCVTASLIIFLNYLLILCLSQNQRCCRERVLPSSKVTPVAPDPDTKVNKKSPILPSPGIALPPYTLQARLHSNVFPT